MLLKRLEVTVQSFLWSEKVNSNEQEVRIAINAQQQFLNVIPANYQVSIDVYSF